MGLLDEIRGDWPPDSAGDPTAYRRADLGEARLLDALELPTRGAGRGAVAIAVDASAGMHLVPLHRALDAWRRARPGDGVAAALVGALAEAPIAPAAWGRFRLRAWRRAALGAASAAADLPERALGVDQTNDSVIVGEAAVVKWYRHPGPDTRRAPVLLAQLAAAGFTEVPAPIGTLSWSVPGGEEIGLALVDGYLPAARDGWDWCVEAALEATSGHADPGPVAFRFGGDLGALVARLHAALAAPTSVIPDPVSQADAGAIGDWRAAAGRMLTAAIDLQAEDEQRAELARYAPAMTTILDQLDTVRGTAIQPIHGDLHVGQVLRWTGGFAVIDFDGNPTLAGDGQAGGVGHAEGADHAGGADHDEQFAAAVNRQPAARDVAQMVRSLDHVGRVVDRRTRGERAERVEQWIGAARRGFLDAYTRTLAEADRASLFDERLLAPFEVEQECRELVYAARFLPRWRYAPMAALARMLA